MNLRHFKIFVAVCDNMSMSKASENLYISQSAVSQGIAEIEKHYGVRLFERLSRKLYLTEAGSNLLGYARHMVNMQEKIEKEMKLLEDNVTLRIGASVTVGSQILPVLVRDFLDENPNISVEVFEDNTEKIEGMIQRDQIDLGLVEGETVSEDILNFPFMDDELVLICGRSHPFSGRDLVDPLELEKENFILREKGSGTRKIFEDRMAGIGITWKTGWTCNNVDTIKVAVAEGLGVSVISRRVVSAELQAGLLQEISIRDLDFKRQFKIVYHKNKYISRNMKKLIELIQK